MEFIFMFIVILVVPQLLGKLLYHDISNQVSKPGRELHQKFISLGNFGGKSIDDITKICGQYNSISYLNNVILCQWLVCGYHISIVFDSNRTAIRKSHESINY